MNNAFGIDLGTSTIKIYNKSTDSTLVQKNMIAIQNKTTVLAYGDEAYDMYEKAPSNIKVTYPSDPGNSSISSVWSTIPLSCSQ